MFPNTSYYVNLENGPLLSDTALSWKMILRASEVIESHRKVMGEICLVSKQVNVAFVAVA